MHDTLLSVYTAPVARTLGRLSVYGLYDLRPNAKAQPALARQLPHKFELVLCSPATTDS